MNKKIVLFASMLGGLAAVPSQAQTSTIPEQATTPITSAAPPKSPTGEFRSLGDPAPLLTVAEWVKGKPVKMQLGGNGTNIYVLVFSTLSRANDVALTNLSSLQSRYADKGVITVAVSDDPPETLRAFVQTKGAEINFSVAADDIRRTISNYQRFFRQMMFPRAYIVGKDGNVLWFGHPLRDDMGQVVDDIVAGRFSLEREKNKVVANQQMEQYLALARQDDPRTAKAGRIMLTLRTNDAPALCDLAFQIATAPYIEKRDVALATAALDRASQLSTTNAADIAVDRAILLFQTGKKEEGLAKAREALTLAQTEADKDEANTCIRAMEKQLAMAQSSPTNTSSTNLPAGHP